MILRASKSGLQKDACRQWPCYKESPQLPWLYPIYYRACSKYCKSPNPTAVQFPPSSNRHRPKHLRSTVANSVVQRRGLASAVTLEHSATHDEFIPFENPATLYHLSDGSSLSPLQAGGLSTIQDIDTSSPLIIKHCLMSQPKRFRSTNAVSGEILEIKQTLQACIYVGRLQRAAALMRRLNQIYNSDAPELLDAHNEYLWELVHKVKSTRDRQLLKDIYKWFEVDLRGVGVSPDGITYALMIQASFQESISKKRDRTVRRFMSLADEAGLREDVMFTLQFTVNSQEVGMVTQVRIYLQEKTETYFFQIAPVYSSEGQALEPPSDEIQVPEPSLGETSSTSDQKLFEIRSTTQKGLGLTTLKSMLSLLSEPQHMPPNNNLSTSVEEERNAIKMQQQLEINTYESAMDRWRKENEVLERLGIRTGIRNRGVGSILWVWHQKLVPLLRAEIHEANEAENKKVRNEIDTERCLSGPFLQILTPEKLAAITILSSLHLLSTHGADERGVSLAKLVTTIGRVVKEETLAENIRTSNKRYSRQFANNPNHLRNLLRQIKMGKASNGLLERSRLLKNGMENLNDQEWGPIISARIGAILFSQLIKAAQIEVSRKDPTSDADIQETQAAFTHLYKYLKGKRVGVVRLHRAVAQKLTSEPVHCVFAKHLPMLVRPKPWTALRNGGFLEHPSTAIRLTDDVESRRYANIASSNGDMDQIFAGLDVLAETPWRINNDVFKVMVDAWNTGEKMAKLAPENPSVTYPPEPAPDADPKIRARWYYNVRDAENQKMGQKAVRCFQNFQIEVARAYLNKTFYMPHNLDFRGRAYPMVPFLNHMGADPCRGLLVFAQGKELGENGLQWLKIHLASLYGYDKATFEERCKFTQDHLPDIYDSAANPLNGKRWWLMAEDPWQCLGACIELKNALDMPDPRRFVSHLPIHQDGSCNGLQHYAALGGDSIGAKQVNLEPGDNPQDLYSAVADMVRANIAEDALRGHELAQALEGCITRKVVKTTVMTKVYGVTFIGAKEQVHKRLSDALTDFPSTDTVNLDRASIYIATHILGALSTMFTGAHEIQKWFTDAANMICRAVTPEQIEWIQSKKEGKLVEPNKYAKMALRTKSSVTERDLFKTPVIWTTPLKMPVVQPYRSNSNQDFKTNLQRVTVNVSSATAPVDRRRQVSAFAPNFIHSLDASHMILTALKCNEMGLTFASVHDSFWTHAGDVDTMNEIIRDTFIRMHSDDIIARLRAEFQVRHKGCLYLASISTKTRVAKAIKSWRHGTRSRSRLIDELLLESRRQKLLASNKQEEQEEGQSMTTPASIMKSMASEKADGQDDFPEAQLDFDPMQADDAAQQESANFNAFLEPSASPLSSAENLIEESEEIRDQLPSEHEKAESQEKPKASLGKYRIWLPLEFAPVPKRVSSDHEFT